MNSNPTDDELLRSYLLGELSEDAADAVEGRLLTEDELFELSEAIEADLLAEYAQGSLAPAERERVRQRLAASPQGRERLRLARSLSVLAAREQAAVLPFVPRTAVPFRRPMLRWAALAAGLLAATGLALFTLEQPHPRHKEGQQPPPPVIGQTSPDHPVPAPPPVPAVPPVVPAPEPVKAVFTLSLASLRGSEPMEEKLQIPAKAETVELQISVEGLEGYKSFKLTLRDRNGGTVKAWPRLKPKSLHGVRALVVYLPVEKLPDGKYEIQAQGFAPGGEPDDLSPLEVEFGG